MSNRIIGYDINGKVRINFSNDHRTMLNQAMFLLQNTVVKCPHCGKVGRTNAMVPERPTDEFILVCFDENCHQAFEADPNRNPFLEKDNPDMPMREFPSDIPNYGVF